MSVWEKLSAEFPRDAIRWRIGSTNREKTRGLALAYIDTRDVMNRFDEAVGPENWECRFPIVTDKLVICELRVRINGEWIVKADGAGYTDVEGEKGAISDARKRAAVSFGPGRYLYDLESPWVPVEAHGNSYRIPDHINPWDYVKKPVGVTKSAPASATPPAPIARPAATSREKEPPVNDSEPYEITGKVAKIGEKSKIRMEHGPRCPEDCKKVEHAMTWWIITINAEGRNPLDLTTFSQTISESSKRLMSSGMPGTFVVEEKPAKKGPGIYRNVLEMKGFFGGGSNEKA